MKVLFCGSFNPFHSGHQYVYDTACEMFGKENVWLGVGYNPSKPNINKEFLEFTLKPITNNIITYSGLTANVVKEHKFDLLIRGIRPSKSLEQEDDLLFWNMKLAGVKTIFVPTPHELNHISSSVIRELTNNKVKVDSEFINQDVYHRWLKGKVPQRYVYFGKSCVGKSTYLGNYALNIDKELFNFLPPYIDKKGIKNKCKEFFIQNDVEAFNDMISLIGKNIEWELLFVSSDRFDFPAIGVYWEYIPIEVRSHLKLIKLDTSYENRVFFASKRILDENWLNKIDSFYQDPPYWDNTITIER